MKRILVSILLIASLLADEGLSLKQAEALALVQNKEIRLSEEELSQFYSRRLQSIASCFPKITFSSMYANLQKPQTFLGPLGQSQFTVNQFQLNQPLFSTDLIFEMRASKLYWKSTEANRNISINNALLQVRSLYYLVVLKEISLKVQEEVISYLAQSLEEEGKKYETGSAISFEVNQSKVALNNAISTYHSLLKDFNTACSQLTLALGNDPALNNQINLSEKNLPIESFPELSEKLGLLKQKSAELSQMELPPLTSSKPLFSEEEIQRWIALAKQNRPDIKKSDALMRAAKEEVNYQKGRYFPTVSGFIDYGYYLPLNGLFVPQQKNWASGIQLQWDIFDSFKRELQIKESGHVRASAKIQLEQTRDKTSVEVRNQIYEIEEALFSYLAAYAGLELAGQAMKEAKIRLAAGTIRPLEYRDAVRAYAEAYRQSNQVKYSLIQSYFQLRHDAGIDVH